MKMDRASAAPEPVARRADRGPMYQANECDSSQKCGPLLADRSVKGWLARRA